MYVTLDRPRLYVDFNEMLDDDNVLLAQFDEKTDSDGNIVPLAEGVCVYVYQDDPDIDGNVDYLVADGVCKKNIETAWSKAAKWKCEIDGAGIRHLSDFLVPSENT